MQFRIQTPLLFKMALMSIVVSITLVGDFRPSKAMPGETQSPDNPAAVKAGLTAAGQYCMPCHAVIPGTKSSNKLAPTFESIAAKYSKHNMVGLDIYDGTVYRHPGMPQFELETFEADGLIAFLRWLGRSNH